MNDNLQEPRTQGSARRRLVRGAFAAPAALSLYNGSAFATTSMTCVAREVNAVASDAIKYPAASTNSDTYIRVRLYRLKKDASNYTTWVKGMDLGPWSLAGKTRFLTDSQWLLFSKVGNSSYNLPTTVTTAPAETGYVLNQDGDWVALKLDEVGNIKGVVGIGANTTGESAVHKSCWTTFI